MNTRLKSCIKYTIPWCPVQVVAVESQALRSHRWERDAPSPEKISAKGFPDAEKIPGLLRNKSEPVAFYWKEGCSCLFPRFSLSEDSQTGTIYQRAGSRVPVCFTGRCFRCDGA